MSLITNDTQWCAVQGSEVPALKRISNKKGIENKFQKSVSILSLYWSASQNQISTFLLKPTSSSSKEGEEFSEPPFPFKENTYSRRQYKFSAS
jgi:hypothetical protein